MSISHEPPPPPPGGTARDVTVRVFGGPRMWSRDAEVAIGPPQRQAVLALLLAARGQMVATSTMIDAVWGANPADSSMNQLQRHIGEIRRLFEPSLVRRAAGRWLASSAHGYRLDVTAADCDLTNFTDFLARARTVAAQGDTGAAHELYARAWS